MLNDAAKLKARAIVEKHIADFGMISHPDILKEAIAQAIRNGGYPAPRDAGAMISNH